MKISGRQWIFATVVVFFSGCGYQIKAVDPRSIFESYAIAGDQQILACKKVAGLLESAGLTNQNIKGAVGVVVRCLDAKTDRRAVSVDANSLGAEYRVVYSVRYGLESSDGRQFVRPFWITRSDSFFYDRDNLLGTYNEEAVIGDELADQVADQMVRAISRLDVSPKK